MASSANISADNAETIGLSRKEIFLLLRDNLNDNVTVAYNKIETLMSSKLQRSFALPENVKPFIRKLLYVFETKWQQVRRTEQKFFDNFHNWLNVFVSFEETKKEPQKRGRPSSEFMASSEKTKRKKTEDIRSQTSVEELSYTTQMILQAIGKLDAAKVVKDVTLGSPSKAKKYRSSLELVSENTLSGDSALSLVIEQKFSKSQYEGLRTVSIHHNCKLYPPYKAVLKAKCKCYPLKSDITITEISAEVKLQALLDHTAERILLAQMDIINSLIPENVRNMNLICKWGCDGSSGQSTYKQKFSDDDGSKSDLNIFIASIVPLQLITIDQTTNAKIIVWKNPRPSSPRFCRPLRIQFLHENTTSTVNETNYIKEQESKLIPFETIMNGNEITVSYKLALTMIDGKVCNAITNTLSTQRCYLCQATSKDFNDIDAILQKKINEDNLQFGLSTLHGWIRFFECCLHLSYKLDIKKWQARTAEEKKKTEIRKKNVQKGFRFQLGLIVDQPKPGYGSTNDGNTARRFFENSTISASITGVDEDIIKRFHVILQVISSGYEIHLTRFQEYTLQTARRFVELYPWFYMPTSMHKILIHGPQIIASSLLPIGQMSEDAQECCNKYIKKFRENFSRKCTRTKTMEDVFFRLLATSDPFISSLRKLPQKKLKSLSPEAVQLLIPPTIDESKFSTTSAELSDNDLQDDSTDDSSDNE